MEKFNLKRLLTRMLRETAEKIDAGTCEMTEEEAMEIKERLLADYARIAKEREGKG